MGRLNPDNVRRAQATIALYPQPCSALLPLLHLAQEQDGWLAPDAVEHVAELLDLTPAEVWGTASFYTMFKRHPVGRYLVSVCTNIACLLLGGYELLEHAEKALGVKAGASTADGEFTLEEVECIAACGDAPCLQVNYRFFGNVTSDGFDRLVADLRAGRLASQVPPHGTLSRVERVVAPERRARTLVLEDPAKAASAAPVAPPAREGAAASPSGATGEQKGAAAVEAQPADEETISRSAAAASTVGADQNTAGADQNTAGADKRKRGSGRRGGGGSRGAKPTEGGGGGG